MENILVIGAHGHVGKQIVAGLGQANYQGLAGLRTANQFNEYQTMKNVKPVLFDLNASIDEMVNVLTANHVQKLVFTAGSGGATGDDQTLIIDLDGAIKTMIAAKQAHIQHYVMISAMGADDRSFWAESGLHGYYIAKHYADDYLKKSGLDYTIIRPAALTNDNPTGKVSIVNDRKGGMAISRGDVAHFAVNVLDNADSVNNIYEITAGSQLINDVIKN